MYSGEWSDDLSLLVVPQVFRGLLREDGSASDVLPSSSSNSVMSKVSLILTQCPACCLLLYGVCVLGGG